MYYLLNQEVLKNILSICKVSIQKFFWKTYVSNYTVQRPASYDLIQTATWFLRQSAGDCFYIFRELSKNKE